MTPGGERDREALSLFTDEMRAARERHGWSQADLARQANFSESLIAMVETHRRTPTRLLAEALDRAFDAPGTFARMERRLRDLPFPASFRPFAVYEAESRALRTFEHSLVPGLLQTEAYARAVLSTRPNTAEADIDGLVAARIARQEVLTREDPAPPLLWVLLDEGVLYRPVAPAEVMLAQLLHLVQSSRLPNVTVNVVPYAAGGHSGLLGAFVIADVRDAPGIVFMEDVSGGRVAEEASVVSEVMLRFDALRSEALPKGASRDLIESVAKERWKEPAP